MPEMLDAAIEGSIKAMWICGYDIAQSDPDVDHVVAALSNLEFLVVQEIFENETSSFAHVILPAVLLPGEVGHVHERRAAPAGRRRPQLRLPAPPRPTSRSTASSRPGSGTSFRTRGPEDVMAEIAELTPHFAGVTYERLGRRGLQWPVAADGTDSPILYEDAFELPDGRAHFAALPYKPPGDEASEEFPLILVTGRRLEHYNVGTMTRRTGNLELFSSDWLEIHPEDAQELGIASGDVVEVRSKNGRIEVEAQVTERIEPGHVFTAFHFPEVRTNLLVGPSADVNTSCPEYKVVAVAVEKTGVKSERPRAVAVA